MRLESRHWTFLGLLIAVTAAMLLNLEIDVPISPQTQKMYGFLDSLPQGSVLIISFDHEASSLPEIRPIGQALLRHAFRRGHRLVGLALLAEGTAIGYRLMQRTAAEFQRAYGADWVYLGFKPQYIAAILSMGESIPATFPGDYLGVPYRNLPLLEDVTNYDDVAAVVSVSDGSLTTHWMEYGGARYGVRVAAGVTAAMVTTYDPYVASGQMHAMVGGLRGAAEYERLLQVGGGGARGMLAQTTAHVYILLLIILGNVIFFAGRQKRRGA